MVTADKTEQRVALAGLTSAEIVEWIAAGGLPAFRGRQAARWVYEKGASDFDQMTDLPASLRQELAAQALVRQTEITTNQRSKDGLDKALIRLTDGQIIESVLLPYPDRVSCCISTQVGCPMACAFCATGMGGYTRNLSVGEMVEQVLQLQTLSERRITHVVFMGMGEPLLNLNGVVRCAQILNEEMGISMRHLTVSTVGIVPKIQELAEKRLQLTLAVSLHAADDETRSSIMPVNNKWGLKDLFSACRDYVRITGRKVTFEYLMLAGVNDTEEQARKLAAWLKGWQSAVNLIPFNYVETPQGYRRPTAERIRIFRSVLEAEGVCVTQRVERGHDIAGACGQLRGQHEGRFKNRYQLRQMPVAGP